MLTVVECHGSYSKLRSQRSLTFIIEKQFINEGTFVLRQGLKSNPQRLQLLLMNELVQDIRLNTDNEVINIDAVLPEAFQRQLILADQLALIAFRFTLFMVDTVDGLANLYTLPFYYDGIFFVL